jgi:flagellar biosynthetic protein FliQ
MSESFVLSFAQNAIMVAVILAAPALVTSLIIGSVISLFQSATQIQETTLTFIPKIIGVGLVVAILGSWMIQKLIAFTANIFTSLPDIIR